MSNAAVVQGGGIRWPLALGVALGAHLAVAGMVALKPEPPAPLPPPPPPILMDLAPPAPPAPPPPTPAPKPVAQAPTPKPPPVIERAAAKLPPPPPRPAKVEPAPEAPPVTETASAAPAAPSPDSTPAASAPAGGAPADAMASFQGRLMAHLAKHKRYPMAARQRRQQGTAWVRLTLDRNGHVLSHRMERGCGVEILDREAEELLERAQPLPEIPAELGKDQMELVLPVEFSLK